MQDSEEGQQARFEAVLHAVEGDIKEKPVRRPYLEAFAEMYGDETWETEYTQEWKEKKAAAEAEGTKVTPAPHVRRDLLRQKWSESTEDEQREVYAAVEKKYAEDMEEYDADESVRQHEPSTPQEAAKSVHCHCLLATLHRT